MGGPNNPARERGRHNPNHSFSPWPIIFRPAGARFGLSISYPQLALWATDISSASPTGGLLNSIMNPAKQIIEAQSRKLEITRPSSRLSLDNLAYAGPGFRLPKVTFFTGLKPRC